MIDIIITISIIIIMCIMIIINMLRGPPSAARPTASGAHSEDMCCYGVGRE